MNFELKSVVPWGRNLDEYRRMFDLNENDLSKKIISFGDGPASFNAEMTLSGHKVISLDPIYQFSKNDIRQRIEESKETVLKQTILNKNNFVWKEIKNISNLEQTRMKAMRHFIDDFELGKNQGRYIYHQLPNATPFANKAFQLGLSSHFLFLYDQLGLQFHIESITEMLRVCNEVRIFPLINLNGEQTTLTNDVIHHFKTNYQTNIITVNYEFQKGGNQMLSITCKD